MITIMNNQFTEIASIPDYETAYYCRDDVASTQFTHLMKLVMMVKRFPDALHIIREIIETNPEEIDKQNQRGWSPLMLACYNCFAHSSIECVKLLIDSGANVDLQNEHNYNALMLARNYSNDKMAYECFNLLIGAGTNLSLTNACHDNILMLICQYHKLNSSPKCIKLLVESGCDINLQDRDGQTALILACINCRDTLSMECIDLLIELGADVNLSSNHRRNALMSYCEFCNFAPTTDEQVNFYCESNLMMLIDKTTDLLLRNNNNRSAYDYFKENSSHQHICNDRLELLLKGIIKTNDTKSARNV